MCISEADYRKIERNDLVRKKNGCVYRVTKILDDSRRDMLVCSTVNRTNNNVVSLTAADIDKFWKLHD